MKTIALVSTVGGAGKTTVTAALAVLLARRGRPVAAADLDPQNMLGAHLGLDTFARAGLGHAMAGQGEPWHGNTWRNADGVLFAPHGETTLAERTAYEARLAQEPHWLVDALARIDFPARGVALLDTARFPSQQAAQAVRAADLVLCVTPPDPAGCATLARCFPSLRETGALVKVVVNRLNPARDMQRDALVLLRAAVGDALELAHRVHFDAAMPESLARGEWLFDEAPHSQASHDLHGLANWIDAWLDGTLDVGMAVDSEHTR
ncbi:cellulose synthase operon protein YhjQ [Trinickia dabaoshanensis]|uniref:Cellulose synthase operon protein YhjQ n=1 Tax=Trinickia dabaoshanensis TaxID=564714 RepID=A0A2N7VCT3_9BURK|nr:cellulose biosynthesis protein BcsQ [Trinickia dabaoshanensis]PMS14966.1 cellulose synthase operon protein YhjQ [Trinickia dabaoshanensis]